MNVLVIVESADNKLKKASREAVSFAANLGGEVVVVAMGKNHDESELASIGAKWCK